MLHNIVSFPDPPPPFRQFYLNKIDRTAEVGLGTRLRHMYNARVAMFAVTSLRRPLKCPFFNATHKRTNAQTGKD